MLTWGLDTGARSAAPLPAGQVDGFMTCIVESIGEPGFGQVAIERLNQVAAVDFWSVYRLAPDGPPRMFVSGSGRGRDVSAECFRCYREGLYRHDHTFAGVRGVAGAGAAAMTLWNESEIPSPHRDQIYRRHDIRERLSIVAGDAAAGLLAVNLYRYQRSGSYRDDEIDTVQTLARGLLASVRKHIQFVTAAGASQVPDEGRAGVLRGLCPALTPRELEVCERLLRGWTYDGIAADLGLTPASVKTYRARAFDRLGIHFRNELFALVSRK